jgi:glycerol uptake facilitator protein
MNSAFLGEYLGTAILILLGGGVCASVSLEKSYAKNAGWIVVTAGWALAVACGIFVSKAFGGPGGLNPVGPMADMALGKGEVGTHLGMIVAEFFGAFTGATLVWLHYLPHWALTSSAPAKLGVFCTAPAIRDLKANFISEALGTFALVFIASSVGKAGPGMAEAPLIGMVVWAVGLGLGGTTGYAINPARDFGPRLAHDLLPIAGKGGSDWGYSWVPVVGPVVGGVLAALAFRVLGG